MGLKKILFENVVLPLAFTAGALGFFSGDLNAQPKNQLGYFSVDNVPVTKLTENRVTYAPATFKQNYYIWLVDKSKRVKGSYIMIRFKNTGNPNIYQDKPIRFDLNEEGDKINGIQLMTDVYSKEMINTILSVRDTTGMGIISDKEYNWLLRARETTYKSEIKKKSEIEEYKKKYALLGNLTNKNFYNTQWSEVLKEVLHKQEQKEKLDKIRGKIQNGSNIELEKIEKNLLKKIKASNDSINENESKRLDLFFKEFKKHDFKLDYIQDDKTYKYLRIVIPGKNYFFGTSEKDSSNLDYIGFHFNAGNIIEHNVLILKDKKTAQISIIHEKLTEKLLEDILNPYIKKNKFKGQMYVIMGEDNIPFGNLLGVLAKENYTIKKNQIQINRDKEKEILVVLDKDGKINRVKENSKIYSDISYNSERSVFIGRISK